MRTITCSDCGTERKTKYKNTKYCLICRLARNLKFIGDATSTCQMCEKPFAPLKRGDELCGKCDDIPSAGDPHGDCALCEAADVPIVNEDVRVCRPCSTDPDKRKLFRLAVMQKRKARMNE